MREREREILKRRKVRSNIHLLKRCERREERKKKQHIIPRRNYQIEWRHYQGEGETHESVIMSSLRLYLPSRRGNWPGLFGFYQSEAPHLITLTARKDQVQLPPVSVCHMPAGTAL